MAVFRGPHSGIVYFDDIKLWNSAGIPVGEPRNTVCKRLSSSEAVFDHLVVRPNHIVADISHVSSILSITIVDEVE